MKRFINHFQAIMGQFQDGQMSIDDSTDSTMLSRSEDEISDWDNCAPNGNCDTLKPAMKMTVKVQRFTWLRTQESH